MSSIGPIGGGSNSFDPNRQKTPGERFEEMKGRLRERIIQLQQRFKERMKKKVETSVPTPGKSLDTGHVFDSADLPDMPAPKPEPERNGDGLNEVA